MFFCNCFEFFESWFNLLKDPSVFRKRTQGSTFSEAVYRIITFLNVKNITFQNIFKIRLFFIILKFLVGLFQWVSKFET